MDIKINNKIIDVIFFSLIIFIIVLLIFTLSYMMKYQEAFTENPFTYGANKIGGDVYCSCYQQIKTETKRFEFNNTAMWDSDLNLNY